MRIKSAEYQEFVARFYCASHPSGLCRVPIEIETASGDLAATAYISEEDSARGADWLKLFRTAGEVGRFDDHVPEATTAEVFPAIAEIPVAEGLVAWTFESHRRDCPHCSRRIMKAATLCGYCWTILGPEAESPEMRILDVGPVYREPVSTAPGVRRACPTCGKPMMAEAALCGYCWARPTG